MSYGWSLDDGHGFHNFLLVHLRAWAVEITDDCAHACFVAHSCSEMYRLFGVVLWEALDLRPSLARLM